MKNCSDIFTNNSCTFVIGFKTKFIGRELKSKKYINLPDYDLLISTCKTHLYKTKKFIQPLNVNVEEEYYHAENNIDNEFLIAAFNTLNKQNNLFFMEDERKINQLAELIRDNEMRTGRNIKSDNEYMIMARKYMWEAMHVDLQERIALASKMKEKFILKMKSYPYMSYFPLSIHATPLEQILQDSKYTETYFVH